MVQSVKKYLVYDATSGLNETYNSKEEAMHAFWTKVIRVTIPSDPPYMVIQEFVDGTKKWFDDKNNEIQDPTILTSNIEIDVQSSSLSSPNISSENKTFYDILQKERIDFHKKQLLYNCQKQIIVRTEDGVVSKYNIITKNNN